MKAPLSSILVKQKSLELGFHKVGIALVGEGTDEEAQRLQAWLDKGYQADMGWMANPKRQDIRASMSEVKSLICVAINYYTPHQRPGSAEYAKISRYGWGRDYHKILHKKLKVLADWVRSQGEGIEARYYADTGPIQDKVWAQRAGIGWIAKNGNVISREYGSWVCDICQDVCPWNQRFAKPTDVAEFEPYPENIAPTLAELAEISEEEWNRRFTASALRRIKSEMLRRNARGNQIISIPVQPND